jgi:hypothetical protein
VFGFVEVWKSYATNSHCLPFYPYQYLPDEYLLDILAERNKKAMHNKHSKNAGHH